MEHKPIRDDRIPSLCDAARALEYIAQQSGTSTEEACGIAERLASVGTSGKTLEDYVLAEVQRARVSGH